MKQLILALLLLEVLCFKTAIAQEPVTYYNKGECRDLIKAISNQYPESYFDGYPEVFAKYDSLSINLEVFSIKYLSLDTLIIGIASIVSRSQEEYVIKAFFDSKQFTEFDNFIILFGANIIRKDNEGDFIIKKFKPKKGVGRVAANWH